MQPREAAKVIRMLVAAYRPRDWSDESSALYAEVLCEFDAERMATAAQTLIRRHQFMPTIADILAAYREVPEPKRPELPEPPGASPEELLAIIAEGRRRIAEQGGAERPLRIVPEPKTLAVDMADVERRKAEIRAAKEQLG